MIKNKKTFSKALDEICKGKSIWKRAKMDELKNEKLETLVNCLEIIPTNPKEIEKKYVGWGLKERFDDYVANLNQVIKKLKERLK